MASTTERNVHHVHVHDFIARVASGEPGTLKLLYQPILEATAAFHRLLDSLDESPYLEALTHIALHKCQSRSFGIMKRRGLWEAGGAQEAEEAMVMMLTSMVESAYVILKKGGLRGAHRAVMVCTEGKGEGERSKSVRALHELFTGICSAEGIIAAPVSLWVAGSEEVINYPALVDHVRSLYEAVLQQKEDPPPCDNATTFTGEGGAGERESGDGEDLAASSKTLLSLLHRWLYTVIREDELIQTGLAKPPALPPTTEYPTTMTDALRTLKCDIDITSIVFMCRSGSYSYNLNTEYSDCDYVIVFTRPIEQVVHVKPTLPPRLAMHCEAPFGSNKSDVAEYSAVSLDLFLEDLIKGNSRNIELLFNRLDRQMFCSPLWMKLRERREEFLNSRVMDQYVGFIKMKLFKCEKETKPHTQSKLLYAAYHRLFELQRLVGGVYPVVCLEGEEREYILSLRSRGAALSEAEWGPVGSAALSQAWSKLRDLQALRASSCSRYDVTKDGPPPEGRGIEWIVDLCIELMS